MNEQFAEIVQSYLSSWTAQCWKWDVMPDYGSLVITHNGPRTIYGVVYDIKTGSSDPARVPFAYRKTEVELLHEQPQIFEFLQTTFSCLTLGYEENGHMYYQLPVQPPKIHSFIASATPDQYRSFINNELYLHLIFSSQQIQGTVDELLLAFLHHLSRSKLLTKQLFDSFITTFSLLTANDYRRLKLFLQRVSHTIDIKP